LLNTNRKSSVLKTIGEIKSMNFEQIIWGFNGYLNLLRRLCRGKCHFAVRDVRLSQTVSETIERYLSDRPYSAVLRSVSPIDYEGVNEVLKEYIFSSLVDLDQDICSVIHWDIIEYFGLASTANADGVFNPLVKYGAWKAELFTDTYEKSTVILVEYGDKAILLSLGVV